ncbi:MAG: copper homeostasis protein CutC [Phycisphaeraceae bacterium]
MNPPLDQPDPKRRAARLEVCVASLRDAAIAAKAGAFRIELNSALALGGLTPSTGLVERVVEAVEPTGCATIAMVRPRPGGFAYNADELSVMHRDVALLVERGVAGIALGVLDIDGRIDTEAMKRLIGSIQRGQREVVFHRAFDLTPDPLVAMEQLIDLGVTRILTSGGRPTADHGAPLIRSLVEHAAGRIEILPAGGIRPDNVSDLIATTGCDQVHASLRKIQRDTTGGLRPDLRFNTERLDDDAYFAADPQAIDALAAALRSHG